ncbi:MAG: aminotransferase class V-fold PLP-dependent enzyme [Chloroflexi bacterium]|nr:aminotransferase class V-fold PLP-dependent enzyme [Chloroflexota bacterium]
MTPIYLDYNATTPIDPQVAEAMLPYIHGRFGNPSSVHAFGLEARAGVHMARHQIASMLGCHDDEVIFTSGGTESNNHAIKGVAAARRHRGNHIITSNIEHPAVEEVCRYLEDKDFEVSYLPVDSYGLIHPQQVENAITERTILVTIMHANNEVGTIQPIREIAKIARRHGALMHSDCAQSVGKIPVNVGELGVDLLTISRPIQHRSTRP